MKLFKNSIFQRLSFWKAFERLRNRSGQAMVEYVLILIISVTLLFLAKGLFSSLNNYMTGYIGGYFRCLMTQGELPALGVEEDALKKHLGAGYSCSVAYKHGVPATPAGAGTGNNVGTSKELSKAGSTKARASARTGASSAEKKANKKAGVRSSSGDDGDGYNDSNRFTNNPQNTADTYSTADASAEDYDDSVRSVAMAKSPMYDDKTNRSRPVNSKLQESIMKNTRGRLAARNNGPRSIANKEDDMRPGPRVGKFNPPPKGVASVAAEPEMEMGFGYFMKWLMIAGIGIALFIFFGGQVMNYTNSDSN